MKKKILRKNLLLGAVLMFTVTSLWGCGNKDTSDEETSSMGQIVSEEGIDEEDGVLNDSTEEETESTSDEEVM